MIVDKNLSIMQDSGWADGLRGLASVFVVTSHLSLCFARRLVVPCCAAGGDATRTPALFQYPIFRLISSGHSWVAVFLILLGFVNALKPLKLARSGQIEASLQSLATAALRRTFRLVLPATAATMLSWAACNLGLYERARLSDAFWLYTSTPQMSGSWCAAVEDLVVNLRRTWLLQVDNVYDQPQWALVYLLQGSMMVFMVLLATVSLTARWRATALGFMAWWSFDWSWSLDDPLVGYTVLLGILLAEFSLSTLPTTLSSHPLIVPVLSPILALFGLTLMSIPSSLPESMPWSANILSIAQKIFPPARAWERTVGSTGAVLLILAILISPPLRRLLSTKPLRWLGKVSFPIYLLHGIVLRTVLAWSVFAGQAAVELDETEDEEVVWRTVRFEQPGPLRIAAGIVLSLAVLLVACHLWAQRVEPVFGRITAWCERRMTSEMEEGLVGILNGKSLPSEKVEKLKDEGLVKEV